MRRLSVSLRLTPRKRKAAEPGGNSPPLLKFPGISGQQARGVLSPVAGGAVRTKYAHHGEASTHTRCRVAVLATVVAAAFLIWAHPGWAAPGDGCQTKRCKVAVKKQIEAKWRAEAKPYRRWIARVVRCESGAHGRYRANTGNGYYGGFQFHGRTWVAMGGQSGFRGLWGGWPSAVEQDVRAVRLLKKYGRGQWPVCG